MVLKKKKVKSPFHHSPLSKTPCLVLSPPSFQGSSWHVFPAHRTSSSLSRHVALSLSAQPKGPWGQWPGFYTGLRTQSPTHFLTLLLAAWFKSSGLGQALGRPVLPPWCQPAQLWAIGGAQTLLFLYTLAGMVLSQGIQYWRRPWEKLRPRLKERVHAEGAFTTDTMQQR